SAAAGAGAGTTGGEGPVQGVEVQVHVHVLAPCSEVVEEGGDLVDRLRSVPVDAGFVTPVAMRGRVGEGLDADLDNVPAQQPGVDQGTNGRAVPDLAGFVGPHVMGGVDGEEPPLL